MGEGERGALTSRCLLFVRSSLEGIFFFFLVLQRGGEATGKSSAAISRQSRSGKKDKFAGLIVGSGWLGD